jgi:hypothetical protein
VAATSAACGLLGTVGQEVQRISDEMHQLAPRVHQLRQSMMFRAEAARAHHYVLAG